MARPGQVVPRADSSADQGAQAQIRRLASAVTIDATRGGPAPPSGPRQPAPVADPAAEEARNADLNGGFDAALFAPTDRPAEPATVGAPFGPGANYVPKPYEDDRSFTLRVAQELSASPSAGALAPFIRKLEEGR